MILINNLKAHTLALGSHIEQALSRVVERGWFVLGPEVNAFEEQFANYVGVSRCVTLANGTDALELALRAVGVKANDQVATVANAGMYTATALLAIGAVPLYVDVDLRSHTLTLAECERAIQAGVTAVVVTHLYGRAAPDIVRIAELCRSKNIPLIEDCAQAHGARIDGKIVGAFGNISCFSFYPTKNLGALGDGGAIATDDSALADNVACLRQYGWTSKYEVTAVGARNSRLDEMQAAILLEFLPLLDTWNSHRRAIARLYERLITNEAVSLPGFVGEEYVAHLYVVRTQDPMALRAHLKACDIASEVHYPIPDHHQKVFAGKFSDLQLPSTRVLAQEILTLPCYPEMSDDDVARVAEAVNKWAP